MMYVWLVVGFVLLIKGADYFVEASSSIARALRVPSIIIGLTIVAFGTSAPELAVSTTASLAGSNEIAVGNVIGSNLFNLLVVLGCCGVIRPFAVQLRWDYAASVSVAVILFLMIFRDHYISRPEAIMLLILFAGFIVLIGTHWRIGQKRRMIFVCCPHWSARFIFSAAWRPLSGAAIWW